MPKKSGLGNPAQPSAINRSSGGKAGNRTPAGGKRPVGVSALLDHENNQSVTLNVKFIEPRSNQPRKKYDQTALEQLADSIAKNGVLEPILVREKQSDPGIYEIVAGERRWRAAQRAGLSEIPAVIVECDDLQVAKIALIENIQREDLNPVEEALGYQALIKDHQMTQEEVAETVGRSRTAVTNILRLLNLPDSVQVSLQKGDLSAGHARALLGLNDPSKIEPLADRIVAQDLSVREVEAAVKRANEQPQEAPEEIAAVSKEERAFYKKLEKLAVAALDRRVRITRTEKKKVLEVPYDNEADLQELLSRLCGGDLLRDADAIRTEGAKTSKPLKK